MRSLHPLRRAVALVALLWTLVASVQVVGGCEDAVSPTSQMMSIAAGPESAPDACACLCACGCAGAAAAVLSAVPAADEVRQAGSQRIALEGSPARSASPAPPTEPPRV